MKIKYRYTLKYRYTYRLTRLSDGAFYTGSRSAATCPPEEDFGTHYFTSGVLEKEFRANPKQFTWVILSEDYADDVAMQEDEQRLILESWDEPGRMNRSAYPVKFAYDKEWWENTREGARRRSQSSEWAEGIRKRSQNSEWRKNVAEANRLSNRLSAQNPEHRKNRAEANRRKAKDPEWRKKNVEVGRRNSQNPEWRKKVAAAARKRWKDKDPEQRKMVLEALAKGKARKRAARLANEDTLPFDQRGVPVKKNRGRGSPMKKKDDGWGESPDPGLSLFGVDDGLEGAMTEEPLWPSVPENEQASEPTMFELYMDELFVPALPKVPAPVQYVKEDSAIRSVIKTIS